MGRVIMAVEMAAAQYKPADILADDPARQHHTPNKNKTAARMLETIMRLILRVVRADRFSSADKDEAEVFASGETWQ